MKPHGGDDMRAVQVHARWHRALDNPWDEPPGPIRDHITQLRAAVRRAVAEEIAVAITDSAERNRHMSRADPTHSMSQAYLHRATALTKAARIAREIGERP